MSLVVEDQELNVTSLDVQIDILRQLKLITMILREGLEQDFSLEDIEEEI